MNQEKERDREEEQLLEEQHLQSCREIIRENIRRYEEKEAREISTLPTFLSTVPTASG